MTSSDSATPPEPVYSPEELEAMRQDALDEEWLTDTVKTVNGLKSRKIDKIRHPFFSQALNSSIPQFEGEVTSPTVWDKEAVIEALSKQTKISVTFQTGFDFTVIGDTTYFRGKDGYYNSGVKGYFKKEGSEARSLLVNVTEQLRTVEIAPLSFEYVPSLAKYRSKFTPWRFVGVENYWVEGGGHYGPSSNEQAFYEVTVLEDSSICRRVTR